MTGHKAQIPLLTLPKSGLRISRVGLGTMTFGTGWGWGADLSTSERILNTYVDAGGNLIDTANKYTNGESEEYIGRLTAGTLREQLLIGTKYSLCMDPADSNSLGNHRRSLDRSLRDSLKRLRTDRVDILWIHAWYFESSAWETLRAIDDAVRRGDVLYWAISDTPAWVAAELATTAKMAGFTEPIAIQAEYSMLEHTADRELVPFASGNGLFIAGFAPLAGGILTGKHVNGDHADTERGQRASNRVGPREDSIVHAVQTVANNIGKTLAQVAIAWILEQNPRLVPLVAGTDSTQLEENLGALQVQLPEDAISQLNEATSIELGFPTTMVNGERMQQVMYGPFLESN